MKIQIVKIIKLNIVEFSTKYGSGIGLCENVEGLEETKVYSAEIDIHSRINLNHNAAIVSDRRYFIKHHQDENEIQGLVEQIDEDGLIYLRVGDDCIIMIENDSNQISKGEYLLIKVKLTDLEITIS